MMRPAAAVVPARGRMRLRRPAAAVANPPGAATRKLSDVPLAEVARLGMIALEKAGYYQREIALAGETRGLKVDKDQTFVELYVTGTMDDELLRVMTGRSSRLVQVHLCDPGCANVLTGETLVHGREFSQVKKEDKPWYSNLETVIPAEEPQEDELAKLREAAGLRGEADPPKKDKKEKKEKKKKKKKSNDDTSEGKTARGSDGKKRKGDDEEDSEFLEAGQKKLKSLFKDTGLDPNVKRRAKKMKKARKLGQAKKKKSKKTSKSSGSGEGGSSSTTTEDGAEIGLFDSDRKVKTMAKRYPGCLTANSLVEAKEALLTSSGTTWNLDRSSLPPLFTHFTRQQLAPNMSPPLLQEALTLSGAIDALLQGKAAYAADVLSQRLKALECLSRGAHWTAGRQLELISTEAMTMAEESEALDAAKRAREAEKLRTLMSNKSPAPRSYEADPGRKTGKGKPWDKNYKGKSNDGGRGKGQDKNKDKDQSWRDKPKDKA